MYIIILIKGLKVMTLTSKRSELFFHQLLLDLDLKLLKAINISLSNVKAVGALSTYVEGQHKLLIHQ